MYVKRSRLENYFIFPYYQTKIIFFQTFPGWKMTKIVSTLFKTP